ncbi:MAG: PAS domain-containing protein, partial [Cyanobacteria bacterium J06554_3]
MSQGSDAASPKHAQSPDTELATLKRQYQLLLNAVGEGIYGLDLQGNVTFVNPAAAAMIDWPMAELIGQSMHRVLHYAHQDGSHYPREDCPIYAALHDGSTHRVTNEVFWRKDGTSFPVEYISTPMRDEQGNVIGAVVTFRDITQRQWAESILQQTNEELEKKVRSRTVELYTTNKHLQEMSDLKSRFVSMVCHEFRNPLNNIALSVSSLGRYDQQMPQTQKQTYLKSITANVERMTQMTDDILVLSKLEANRLTLNPQSLDLADFCRTLIKEIPPDQRRLSFTGRFQPLLAEIDPVLLRSILVNILSNAVRYSEASDLVQLSLCQRKQQAVFQIKD